MMLERKIANGEHIEIWSQTDGDGHKISMTVSHVGFLVYISGEDRELVDNPFKFVCTETYLTFEMLEEMFKAMNEHRHLVEEEFRN